MKVKAHHPSEFIPIKEHSGYYINGDGQVKNSMGDILIPQRRGSVYFHYVKHLVGPIVAKYFVPNPDDCAFAVPLDGDWYNVNYKNWKWTNTPPHHVPHNKKSIVNSFNDVLKDLQYSDQVISKMHDLNIDLIQKLRLIIYHMQDNGMMPDAELLFSEFHPLIYNGSVVKKYLINKFGLVINRYTGSCLFGVKNRFGYSCISASKTGEHPTIRIHRAVAETFLPNPENKRDVNHKDGNKWNNCVWNLEWATVHENNKHAVDNGLLPYMPKYSEDQIRHVCELLCSGKYNNRQISDMTGVRADIISGIKRGSMWCRISQEYLDRFKYYDFNNTGINQGELPEMTARTKARIMENMKNSIYRKF